MTTDHDNAIFEAAVEERILAAVDQLPEERREAFLEDAQTGRVRINVADDGDEEHVTYIATDSEGEAVRVTLRAPSPQPPR